MSKAEAARLTPDRNNISAIQITHLFSSAIFHIYHLMNLSQYPIESYDSNLDIFSESCQHIPETAV